MQPPLGGYHREMLRKKGSQSKRSRESLVVFCPVAGEILRSAQNDNECVLFLKLRDVRLQRNRD
jgi:hypothetical protein